MTEFIQVLTTTETKEQAQEIARALVERRLAGCVQLVGPITSLYWWEEEVEAAQEWLCIIKSRQDRYAALEGAIREVHPYEVPEILAVPVVAGNPAYLDWLNAEIEADET